jgi:hypothetical protein
LFNDIDFDSDLLVVNSVGQAQEGGAITNHGDGTYTYYPPSNWDGYDQAEYVIADGFHTASARIEFVAWQGPGNLPDFTIDLKVAAFIPLSKGHAVTWDVPPGEPYASLRWLPEPFKRSIAAWYFGTDDRENFGAAGTSRIYSMGSFQASEIGSFQTRTSDIFTTKSDDSHRARVISAGGGFSAYEHTKNRLPPKPEDSEIRLDGTGNRANVSVVLIKAWGNHPFTSSSPNIDYDVAFVFERRKDGAARQSHLKSSGSISSGLNWTRALL